MTVLLPALKDYVVSLLLICRKICFILKLLSTEHIYVNSCNKDAVIILFQYFIEPSVHIHTMTYSTPLACTMKTLWNVNKLKLKFDCSYLPSQLE
jgi:hypothetical protein